MGQLPALGISEKRHRATLSNGLWLTMSPEADLGNVGKAPKD